MSRDPHETLVIVGGRALTRVDAGAVRACAVQLAETARALGVAAAASAFARSALDRDLWTPVHLGVTDPSRDGRVRWARGLADDAAVALALRADSCASLEMRLLIAAGLYEHAESMAERTMGAVVTFTAGTVGLAVTAAATDPVLGHPLRQAGRYGLAGVAARSDDPDVPHAPPTTVPSDVEPSGAGGVAGWVLRGVAPYVDEAVLGGGIGVAAGAPVRSGLDLSVDGAARVLSRAVWSVLPDVEVTVEPIAPDRFTGGLPAWHASCAGDVAEALARSADLYAHGSGIPGREAPGPPPGTIAVQRVEGADGAVSWTVLIPGTQEMLSAQNPFDVATDLDMMAQESADVMVAVEQALADAGAGPAEPVVLVGHSLGGIAATSLAASPAFRRRHPVGGVVTAGAPTATFRLPRGVPALHLENTEELVSSLDGRSAAEGEVGPDRVVVARDLSASDDPRDRAASGSVTQAHSMATHLRTLEQAQTVQNVQVAATAERIEAFLDGERAETTYYAVRRVRDGE
ncbi:hypothetical protein GCM10009718_13740 [Isoptericola halotolerans]|uniref:PGAP1-like protein n=1 Tax=Isoptericola halotolerans TaxID=300560 RepID=A0ABX1ZZ06_9MICO|nr:hypothetical protein [Isoptericola halotolerans]NOV95706.1 hypothetical protein [Isoptericola halotolerans]